MQIYQNGHLLRNGNGIGKFSSHNVSPDKFNEDGRNLMNPTGHNLMTIQPAGPKVSDIDLDTICRRLQMKSYKSLKNSENTSQEKDRKAAIEKNNRKLLFLKMNVNNIND